jgi:hypothetical protein
MRSTQRPSLGREKLHHGRRNGTHPPEYGSTNDPDTRFQVTRKPRPEPIQARNGAPGDAQRWGSDTGLVRLPLGSRDHQAPVAARDSGELKK